MKAIILDERSEGSASCLLCRISLEDYIKGLPSRYMEYRIQREIVNNVYLDHLVDTVLSRRHIPPIVLVVEKLKDPRKEQNITIDSFKILDGLQRTFRLQAIRRTIDFSNEVSDEDCLSWNNFKFSRSFSKALAMINSTTDVLRSVLKHRRQHGHLSLLESFTKNTQWFEIWTGLTPESEVRKMLTLNAGHKPVKTRHQLELLFLNLLPILQDDQTRGFDLVREKDISATQFSKSRQCGTFHFAHIITALLSFYQKEPIAPSTELIQSLQGNDAGFEEYSTFTSPGFLKDFVRFLVTLDGLLSAHSQVGKLWMGREVSLAGLFAALGAYASEYNKTPTEAMNRLLALLQANPAVLNLNDFEAQRNNLELSKVNIGNVNRAAVFSAIQDLLNAPTPTTISWRQYFRTEGK